MPISRACRRILSKEQDKLRNISLGTINENREYSGSDERTSLLNRPEQVSGADRYFQDLTTQTEVKSNFTNTLRNLVPPTSSHNDGTSVQFSNQFQNKILELLSAANSSKETEPEKIKKMFEKLKTDPLARSRLENLHAGRAFKYGYTQFGAKSWYRESPNVSNKLRTQADRRKFRAGLKSDVDFLNQLNIMDFERILHQGELHGLKLLELGEPVLPKEIFKMLQKVPPIKILELVNKQKTADILKILSKITSMAHFSQSMADFFAHDDALEPALAVVCEALRNYEDVGGTLGKRGTFLRLAHTFQKHRSSLDHDAVRLQKTYAKRETHLRNQQKRKYCFRFQKSDFCPHRYCSFIHECESCGSANHGKGNCTGKSYARKKSSKKYRS